LTGVHLLLLVPLLVLLLVLVRCMQSNPAPFGVSTYLHTMPVCCPDPADWRDGHQVVAEVHKHIHAAPVPQGIGTRVSVTRRVTVLVVPASHVMAHQQLGAGCGSGVAAGGEPYWLQREGAGAGVVLGRAGRLPSEELGDIGEGAANGRAGGVQWCIHFCRQSAPGLPRLLQKQMCFLDKGRVDDAAAQENCRDCTRYRRCNQRRQLLLGQV
jgi:hypothetical protein